MLRCVPVLIGVQILRHHHFQHPLHTVIAQGHAHRPHQIMENWIRDSHRKEPP